MCGQRQLFFFQCGPETTKVWTSLKILLSTQFLKWHQWYILEEYISNCKSRVVSTSLTVYLFYRLIITLFFFSEWNLPELVLPKNLRRNLRKDPRNLKQLTEILPLKLKRYFLNIKESCEWYSILLKITITTSIGSNTLCEDSHIS